MKTPDEAHSKRYSEHELDAIWTKRQTFNLYTEAGQKTDRYGAVMQRDQYGNQEHDFGWEIDETQQPVFWMNIKPIAVKDGVGTYWRYDPDVDQNLWTVERRVSGEAIQVNPTA